MHNFTCNKYIYVLIDYYRQSFDTFRLALKTLLVTRPDSEVFCETLCQLFAISAPDPATLLSEIYSHLCQLHKTQSVNEFLRNKVEPLIEEMATLHRLWKAATDKFPISKKAITFRFNLSCVSKTAFYYNHIVVHVILERDSRPVTIVATGGRYDMMINGYKTLYKQAEQAKEKKSNVEGDFLWPSWYNDTNSSDCNQGENGMF